MATNSPDEKLVLLLDELKEAQKCVADMEKRNPWTGSPRERYAFHVKAQIYQREQKAWIALYEYAHNRTIG